MVELFWKIDDWMVPTMRRYGIPFLRVALGIVYIWFGALKLFGVSPILAMIHQTYSFMPPWFIPLLAIWEVAIGIGLVFKLSLRVTLALMWMQLAGTFGSIVLNPGLFFIGGNPLLLSSDGEFVIKNIVFIAAGIAIGGHEVKGRNS